MASVHTPTEAKSPIWPQLRTDLMPKSDVYGFDHTLTEAKTNSNF